MINERIQKELEAEARKRMVGLQEKNPDCNFSVIIYQAGIREGEVVIQKEKSGGEITDYVIGSADE